MKYINEWVHNWRVRRIIKACIREVEKLQESMKESDG